MTALAKRLAELAERLRARVHHYECEECWYSCATLTCDENRRSEICDCGADTESALRDEILAALSAAEDARSQGIREAAAVCEQWEKCFAESMAIYGAKHCKDSILALLPAAETKEK